MRTVLRSLRHGSTRKEACRRAGISSSTLAKWMKAKDRFALAVERAEERQVSAERSNHERKARDEATRKLCTHLRRGGTRRGACGAAGISPVTLERWESEDPALAEHLEQAQLIGLAEDESELDRHVSGGDKQALFLRLKCVYGYGSSASEKVRGKKKSVRSTKCEAIENEIRGLSHDKRKEVGREVDRLERHGKEPSDGKP